MTGQKARTPVSSPSRRPERPDDTEFLYALFGTVQDEAFFGFDPTLADMLLRQQFAGQSATYRAAYPDGHFDIVEVDGEPVGRIVTDAAHGVLRLVDIALLPDWRGRGIGTRFLHLLQAAARNAGVPLRLSVARSNAEAHRLYERLGFRPVEATETHIGLQWTP